MLSPGSKARHGRIENAHACIGIPSLVVRPPVQLQTSSHCTAQTALPPLLPLLLLLQDLTSLDVELLLEPEACKQLQRLQIVSARVQLQLLAAARGCEVMQLLTSEPQLSAQVSLDEWLHNLADLTRELVEEADPQLEQTWGWLPGNRAMQRMLQAAWRTPATASGAVNVRPVVRDGGTGRVMAEYMTEADLQG